MKVPCEGFTPKEQKTSQHRGVFYWGPSFKIVNFSFFNSGVGVLFDTRRKLRNPILGSILFKDYFHGF